MRDHDLDAEPLIRRGHPGRRSLLAAALLVGTALAGAGTLQAGPEPAAVVAAPPPSARLPVSSETTGSIGGLTAAMHRQEKTATNRQSALPLRERHVLIALLTLCFTVLSVTVHAFWRRSIADFARNPEDRTAIFGKDHSEMLTQRRQDAVRNALVARKILTRKIP